MIFNFSGARKYGVAMKVFISLQEMLPDLPAIAVKTE
jgi:hypothetical protein